MVGNKPTPKANESFRIRLTGSLEPNDVREAIIGGKIRATTLRTMRRQLGLNIEDVADVLGVSKRTVSRKETNKATLSATEADRAYRLARIADMAIELIGDPKRAFSWMQTPSVYLGGKTPIQMLDTEVGTDLVVESLHAIAYGGVA